MRKPFQFNIIKHKIFFFALSLAIILAGVVSAVFQGFNWDIDFTGGTQIQIDLGKEFDNKKLASLIEKEVGKSPSVSRDQVNTNEAIIKTVSLTSEARALLYEKIQKEYDISDMDKAVISSNNFSPTIGKELQQKTIWAAIITIVLILLYITIRFEFHVAVSGILALVHDALILLAVYTIFQIPMNANFVAVILTILGYSINDTVVIFDRIRANLKKKHKESYAVLANASIWQTMSRSIFTAMTTFISIMFFLIFGVSAIKEFAMPLSIGIVAGAYSSIFLAVPISVWLHSKGKRAR